ncbi:hypothetical protein MMC25_006253 [Agyrium rufum]|nr:hypothetical protein [Agyrium rufum]
MVRFKFFSGTWLDGLPPTISAGSQARSLSVVRVPQDNVISWTLFVEDSEGAVNAWYLGTAQGVPQFWMDVTSEISDAGGASKQYAPFAAAISYYYNNNGTSPSYGDEEPLTILEAFTLDQSTPASVSTVYGFLDNGSATLIPQESDLVGQNPAIYQSGGDFVFFSTVPSSTATFTNGVRFFFWVNGTSLANGNQYTIDAIFLYKRLAATCYGTDDTVGVYHQIDAFTIAEEMYSVDINHWTTANITVATTY